MPDAQGIAEAAGLPTHNARRNLPPPTIVGLHKLITTVAWAAFVYTAIESSFRGRSHAHHRSSIWEVNRAHRTPFSLEPLITSIYWGVLFFFQIPYLLSLYSSNQEVVGFALDLAPRFTATAILNLIFIHVWTRSMLWWSLVIAIVIFINLSVTYLFYPIQKAGSDAPASVTDEVANLANGSPTRISVSYRSWSSGNESPEFSFRLLQHYAVLAGPLAFSFVALYWVGAAAFNMHTLFGRILANIAIWGILSFGYFNLVVFGDWVLALCLGTLASSIGLSQLFTHVIALQWIFAFTISTLLCLGGIAVAIPSVLPRQIIEIDSERRPLLGGN